MTGKKKKRLPNDIAVDGASIAMLQKADADGVEWHAFSRADTQGRACKAGVRGVCCRICHMGPCTISESRLGICGAGADTVVARNLLREVAAGAAAQVGRPASTTRSSCAVPSTRRTSPTGCWSNRVSIPAGRSASSNR